MNQIKCIAFDLDDTLLETSSLLVPAATREACQAMQNGGLKASVEECILKRSELLGRVHHENMFHDLAISFSHTENEAKSLSALGDKAFYSRQIPASLPVVAEGKNVLEYLKNKYTLFLVTSGEPETQAAKVKAMQIENYFSELFYIHFRTDKKQSGFKKIIESSRINPDQFLSIGNRRDQEVREAKLLGARTCWLRTGEHRDDLPSCREDIPDYEILDIRDLIKVCRL